jgi:SAM-dependent methyltransferase
MSFTLDKVVAWGRSFEEYVAMFALSEGDLRKRFLGCGDGPANFNYVMTQRGRHVISADPIYHFSEEEIRNRIDETFEEVIEQTRNNMNEFIWKHISSVEELGRVRMAAMNDFLSDYAIGLRDGRYVEASLPVLPFDDGQFDIALCSHFLFLYSEHYSENYHIQSIQELCRVASEVRIFPLLELGSKRSRHIDRVFNSLKKDGFAVHIEQVPYEFQKGGNEMLRVKTI